MVIKVSSKLVQDATKIEEWKRQTPEEREETLAQFEHLRHELQQQSNTIQRQLR